MRKRGFNFLFITIILAVSAFLSGVQQAHATHLRAGEITVQRVNCTGLTFVITITVYTNTGSKILFGDGLLDFGDGTEPFLTPTRPNDDRPDLGLNVGIVVFKHTYTYAGPGRYVISYFEHNRNAGIVNMSNSVETPFFIETILSIDPFIGCDNSPVLTVPPIDKACIGKAWFHNPGAYDIDGDSLSYALVVPKQDKLHDVNGYGDPSSQQYYLGNYENANEDEDGRPTFTINPTTGTISWDAPGEAGQFNIAFHIIEWRKVKGHWIQLGYVTRDMQIIVEDCNNHRPQLIVPVDLCVVAGTLISKDIFGTDPDNDKVKLEAFSQVFSINPSPATVTPSPAVFQTTGPGVKATMHFTWQTDCLHVKQQPYQVVFKATDDGNGVNLVSFSTWNIKVVGPAPTWGTVVSQGETKAKLNWNAYTCENATIMQIWRRVASNPFKPDTCTTGMPANEGYTKIAEVPIKTTQYIDNNGGAGLAAGTQYCYRLVASFPLPQGGLSIVSEERCFKTQSFAPIITNVSIDRTELANGQDTIKWSPPLAADRGPAFPPPFSYSIFRAEGYAGNTGLTQVAPGKITDTVYVDNGLNTDAKIYNYRVVAFASDNTIIDTSAVASSVRLDLKPRLNSMELTWTAVVPWSNLTPAHPQHYIYRGPANSTLVSQLTLIDSVNVLEQRFHYIDEGPLDKTTEYCYCVRTSGGYGNKRIREPLINYSQITCALPNDSTPPCKVTINAKGTNCSDVFKTACAPTTFSNTLTWERPPADCLSEVFRYNIYVSSQTGGAFTPYATNVADTFFIDNKLASFARCYKVAAVSRSGVEGELSEAFCFDNCPYYELPNVFTPGTVDKCNDVFSAFSDRTPIGEGGSQSLCPPREDPLSHCARFVNSVTFTVFNRWGKEVYSYESGGENSIYIDWNGRDDQGTELSSGVYYYLAEVNFNVVDPRKQNQTYKGWVQIFR